MGEELSRHKEALKVAIGALRELGLDYAQFTAMVEKRVAAVLEPPEDAQEVEMVRWECGCGHVHKTAEIPKICGGASGDGWCNSKGPFTRLTGTVKRTVRRAVIREYEVAVEVTKDHPAVLDGSCLAVSGSAPFAGHPECHGKAGVLIFRTAE